MRYDTIIIGAGMSGLAAGIRLAHFEKRVCILERHTTIGGLNSFYRLRGRNYDVGLHAVTNFARKGDRRGPLNKLMRQLRLRWEDFALCPQNGSAIAFPSARLEFGNDLDILRAEIAREFPSEVDGFERLVDAIIDYDDLDSELAMASARQLLGEYISEPLLVEMLLCPLLYYGSASEHDIDFGQFSIMFRSIFMEGLGRPESGVRLILKQLVRRFRALGGELKLRSGVKSFDIADDRVRAVVTDAGETLEADSVLSSAGWVETMRLCGDRPPSTLRGPGQLSFCETISTLDVPPLKLGYDRTITFFNDHEDFVWRVPKQPCDLRSGVICSPNNFRYDAPLEEGTMRVTVLANHDHWSGLSDGSYQQEKLRWFDRINGSAERFVPPFRNRIIDTDMFTPKTIRRFTGHISGAVYGAPVKQRDGRTHLQNLYICGTDQGWVGIIGSLISGISMANRWCMR